MKVPKISVIIPTFNAEKTIKICLDNLLNSSHKPDEIIIVDDYSSDKTLNLIKNYPCIIFKNEKNMGQCFSRNKGAKMAKGDWLLFIDADIELKKNSIKQALDKLKENKDICAITGVFDIYNPYDNILSQYKHLYMVFQDKDNPKYIQKTFTSILLINKAAYFSVGGLDETIKKSMNEDLKLGLELVKKNYKILFDPQLKVIHHRDISFRQFLDMEFYRSRNIAIIYLTTLFKRKINYSSVQSSFKLSLLLSPILFGSLIFSQYMTLLPFVMLIMIYLTINQRFLLFVSKEKDIKFGTLCFFVLIFDMLICFLGCATGTLRFALGERI